jgi:P4 family phage/plasmid primase-like protien
MEPSINIVPQNEVENIAAGAGSSPPSEKQIVFDPAAFTGEKLPAELRELKQFINWSLRPFPHPTKPGEVCGAKTPLGADGKMLPGGGTKEETWTTLDDAVAGARRHHQGVGFAFRKGGGIVGIDIDNAVAHWDGETPILTNIAAYFTNTFKNSYWEWSPSHRGDRPTGLHGFIRGALPKNYKSSELELYSGTRYFTVSGNQFPGGSNIIAPMQEQLNEAYERYCRPATKTAEAKSKRFVLPRVIQKGEIHNKLFEYACSLQTRGVSDEEIHEKVAAANRDRCEEQMPTPELTRVIESVLTSYEKGEPKATRAPGLDFEQAADMLKGRGLRFARGMDEALWVYDPAVGVYSAKGRAAVRAALKEWFQEIGRRWVNTVAADNLADYILIDAPELWERPPLDEINVLNGILNVNTRALRPHSADFLSPIQLPIVYDPAATCPQIDQLCSELLPDDTQHIMPHLAAWLMIPYTDIQKAILFHGPGGNGKSVLLTILQNFLGAPNYSTSSLHRLESGRFSVPVLVGKLANICDDLPTRELQDSEIFKKVTGGSPVTGEIKNGEIFSFVAFSRFIFSGNRYPRSADSTYGMMRRWLIVPTEQKTFLEDDPGTVGKGILDARFKAELPGLLNRALAALPRVLEGSIPQSQSMRDAYKEFRSATDPLTVWLDEAVVAAPGYSFIPKDLLVKRFNGYCMARGKPNECIAGSSAMTQALKTAFPDSGTAQRKVNKENAWCYVGVAWKSSSLIDETMIDPAQGDLGLAAINADEATF